MLIVKVSVGVLFCIADVSGFMRDQQRCHFSTDSVKRMCCQQRLDAGISNRTATAKLARNESPGLLRGDKAATADAERGRGREGKT